MQATVRRLNYIGANGTMRLLTIPFPMIEPLRWRALLPAGRDESIRQRFHVRKPSRERLVRAAAHRTAPPRPDGRRISARDWTDLDQLIGKE
jgi:hypothetical protein